MASLTFKYISEKKYEALSDEEKSKQEILYMVKGANCNSIYNMNRRYASNTDFHILNSEAELPPIGDSALLYVTKEGGIYVWDVNFNRYVDVSSGEYDVINGGDASSRKDIIF